MPIDVIWKHEVGNFQYHPDADCYICYYNFDLNCSLETAGYKKLIEPRVQEGFDVV